MSPAPSVAAIVERVTDFLNRRLALAAGLAAAVAMASVVGAAWFLAGGRSWAQGTAAPLFLDLLGTAALVWVGFLFLRRRPFWLAEQRVSEAVERVAGLPDGSVFGSMELVREVPEGVSRSLAVAAEQNLVRRLVRSPEELAGSLREQADDWVRWGRGTLLVLTALLGVAAVLSPDRSQAALSGLSSPIRHLSGPLFLPIRVAPGDVELLRGAPLAVRVDAPGRDEVTLHWQSPGEVSQNRTLPAGNLGAEFSFNSVTAAMTYWVTVPDGARSDRFDVTLVNPLFMSDLLIELTFPPHTGRLPEEYRGEAPILVVPVGTNIRLQGRATRPLSAASLRDEDDREIVLEVVDDRFAGQWTPLRSGLYRWTMMDVSGRGADTPPADLSIELVADALPSIELTFPGQDTLMPLSRRQPLIIEAQDDYGIGWIELVASRVTSVGERKPPVTQRIPIGGTRGVLVRPLLDLSDWDLMPGDTVRYLARVVDNAPRAQVSETREFALWVPGASELRWEAQEQLDEAARLLEELAERVAEAEQENRDLARQAEAEQARDQRSEQGRPDRTDFEQQEDLRQALEEQERLMEKVDSLGLDLSEMAEALREQGLTDPDLRRDMEELQELLKQLAAEEMQERLESMNEALESMDPRKTQETLEQLALQQEDFRERLEEALERFRQAAVEQEFRATTEDLEELAQKEEALADAMREDDDLERRADQQLELDQDAADLEERLEQLQERLTRMGEMEARQGAETAGEKAQEAREAMREAMEAAGQERNQEAGERADEAAEALREAAEQLESTQEQMQQDQNDASQEAMERTASDALALARRQSELRQEMRRANPDKLSELRGDEAALLQGVRNMAESTAMAQRMARGEDREMATALGQAMMALEQTIQGLDNARGPTPSPYSTAEGVVDALNSVAMMAMASGQNEGQEGEGTGAESTAEQLEQMAEQQGELAQQSSQIMPMQLGEEALQQQLEEMARGQEQVADELGELADQPGSEEESLGDLEALAQEALALAQELARGRLDPETLERQEQLFHRLLDAGRSLEKEEFSEERESEAPQEFEREDVGALTAEDLNLLRFPVPGARELQSLPPAQRALVLKYFELLNRSGSGRTLPPGGP